MTFLVNLMFSRLDKFDGPILGWVVGGVYRGGLIFGMLIDLDIWWTYIRGGGTYIRGAHLRDFTM